jgi:hypothetical protein
MRTLGARAHLLLALAAAAALVASLGLPWYGAAPLSGSTPEDGDIVARADAAATAVARALGERGGVTGWDALAREDLVVCGLAAAVALLLLLSLARPLEQASRGLARLAALAALGVVVWRAVDVPAAGAAEPRYGLLAALAAAAVLLLAAAGAAAAPSRRPAPVRAYVPPPPPAYDATASYGPPQY